MAKVFVAGVSVLFSVIVLAGCNSVAALPSLLGPPGSQAPARDSFPAGGGWTGTVTYKWSTHTDQSGGDVSVDTADEKYEATATIGSQQVDVSAWTFSGSAKIVSTRVLLFTQTTTSPDLTCTEHHDDEAMFDDVKTVDDGGLELTDDFYNLRVEIPGATGSETSVRQYSSGCGTNETDTHPWEVAAVTILESGTAASLNHISGTDTNSSGATTTWDLSR